jgi:hypothetical protein
MTDRIDEQEIPRGGGDVSGKQITPEPRGGGDVSGKSTTPIEKGGGDVSGRVLETDDKPAPNDSEKPRERQKSATD